MQTLHIPTYIHTYWQCFLLCSPYIFLASFVLSFLVAFEVPRICNWLQLIAKCIGLKIEDSQKNFFNPGLGWRLKILRKTSSIQSWIEDWRFSEKLLQSNPGLKMWSQTWIEEVFLRIFNLQSRPGLKKFFWESSIFNPDLDWRSFSENLQSSIRHMQLIASSRYFEGNQKWQEKLQKCKNGGFWGGTRQIDRYMYTHVCMHVCM